MAIRIRKVKGRTIALCAAKTDAKPKDIYLNDGIHHALSVKFERDFYAEGLMESYGFPQQPEWKLMDKLEKQKETSKS